MIVVADTSPLGSDLVLTGYRENLLPQLFGTILGAASRVVNGLSDSKAPDIVRPRLARAANEKGERDALVSADRILERLSTVRSCGQLP